MPFSYEAATHTYYIDGAPIPSVTQMLKTTGWVDDTFYTDDGRERGTAVHHYTAQYDLGVLELAAVPRNIRAWVLAYIEIMERVRPVWDYVEVPFWHPTVRFGGTPDRVGIWQSLRTVAEQKSGAPRPADAIQTALQAILVAHTTSLPAPAWQRLCFYLKPNGRFVVERHPDKRDYDEAHRVLRACCGG